MIVNYILFFCIYSFVGWVLETTYASLRSRKFVSRGFLKGPFLPIYGFGALLIIISSSWIYSKYNTGLISIGISLIASIFLVTLLEYITGFALEKLFNERWWDYSNNYMNIKGYVCLEFSLIWGMLAFVVIQIIQPRLVQLTLETPVLLTSLLSLCFLAFITLDTIISVNKLTRKMSDNNTRRSKLEHNN